MYSSKCIICGWGEDEVKKMHYFPRNLEKSKAWQQEMGIVFSGESLRNYRICNRHFTPEAYIGDKVFVLKKDAVPTRFSSGTHSLEFIEVLASPVPARLTSTLEEVPLSSPAALTLSELSLASTSKTMFPLSTSQSETSFDYDKCSSQFDAT